MRELKTFFFTRKKCIYNIKVKFHNECTKIYSDTNIANSLPLTNVSILHGPKAKGKKGNNILAIFLQNKNLSRKRDNPQTMQTG